MRLLPQTQTRAMWLVIGVAIMVTLVATELALGAIKTYWGGVSDSLYVVVFAAASVASLLVSFFVLEIARDLLDELKSNQNPDQPW
jgi:hypothetical protein